MKKVLLSMALGLSVTIAAPLSAQPPAAPAPEGATAGTPNAGDDESGWIHRLDEAAQRLVLAQKNLDRLDNAKGKGAARRYPRGDAKAKYLDQLDAAKKELAEAQEALPKLVEEARRAGIPNGTLDPYENPSAIAASDDDDGDDDGGNGTDDGGSGTDDGGGSDGSGSQDD